MKSIDPLLSRKFDRDHYHCVHFLVDAAQYLFDCDFSPCFLGLTGSIDQALTPTKEGLEQAVNVNSPHDGTIVLILTLDNRHHVGLYYCGRVLHLTENGVRFESLRTIKKQHKEVSYYEVKSFS